MDVASFTIDSISDIKSSQIIVSKMACDYNGMSTIAIRKVKLGKHHLNPGRTKHTLCDDRGVRPFPPFTSLAITRYGNDPGYYLVHICADNTGTDTWQETLEDAIHQAEWEFGVRPDEWTGVDEPFEVN